MSCFSNHSHVPLCAVSHALRLGGCTLAGTGNRRHRRKQKSWKASKQICIVPALTGQEWPGGCVEYQIRLWQKLEVRDINVSMRKLCIISKSDQSKIPFPLGTKIVLWWEAFQMVPDSDSALLAEGCLRVSICFYVVGGCSCVLWSRWHSSPQRWLQFAGNLLLVIFIIASDVHAKDVQPWVSLTTRASGGALQSCRSSDMTAIGRARKRVRP